MQLLEALERSLRIEELDLDRSRKSDNSDGKSNGREEAIWEERVEEEVMKWQTRGWSFSDSVHPRRHVGLVWVTFVSMLVFELAASLHKGKRT